MLDQIKLILIFGFLIYFFYQVYKACRSVYRFLLASGNNLSLAVESWSRVNAKITVSELAYHSFKESWDTEIRYEYSFNGQDYIGNMLAPISFTSDRKSEKQKIVTFFKVGSVHKIYVNPKTPAVAYLVPKIETSKIFPNK